MKPPRGTPGAAQIHAWIGSSEHAISRLKQAARIYAEYRDEDALWCLLRAARMFVRAEDWEVEHGE